MNVYAAHGWAGEDAPSEPGWYAALRCWDTEEGVIPGALRWTLGGIWERNIVGRSAQSFASEAKALDWAYAHDPDVTFDPTSSATP